MSSSQEFVSYVAGQFAEAGDVTYLKMFGEYGLYCNGKIFALVCDNQLFVKVTEAGRALLPGAALAPPYTGSKPYMLIEELENKEQLVELCIATCRELPPPKPKKKKQKPTE